MRPKPDPQIIEAPATAESATVTWPLDAASGAATPPAIAPQHSPAPPARALPPTELAPPPPAHGRRGNRGFRLLLVLVLVGVACAGYGAYWWTYLRGTVSTDDAYVEARIVSVASRLAERVEAVLAKEGDLVRAGQTVARFVDDKLRIGVAEARARVRAAEAALQETRNGARPEEIQVAQAEVRVLEVELSLQQKEWERAQRLAQVRAISAQELERRRAAVATAESHLEVSRRRLTLLLAGRRAEEISGAEAALSLARSQLDAALADQGDANLRAPVTGIIARQMVDPGEVVQKGQALFQVVESGNSWIVANLEEDEISRIHEGQPVRIWVDAYPGREFQGRVGPLYAATLSRFSLLPSSSASGSFIKVTQRVPVRIDWTEKDLPPFYPGLNVVIRITVDQP